MSQALLYRCTACRRNVAATTTIPRHGGGTYRRPGRTYWREVCLRCAQQACDSLGESERQQRHAPQYDHTPASDWRRALERLTALTADSKETNT